MLIPHKYFKVFQRTLPLLCVFVVSCGILIGNPEDEPAAFDSSGEGHGVPSFFGDADAPLPPSLASEFNEILENYLSSTLDQEPGGVDCGLFDTDASESELVIGRDCLRAALSDCHPAKLYVRQITNEQGDQYASFARVNRAAGTGECSLKIRTASSDEDIFFGDITKSCQTLGSDESPEFACGIVATE